ncbi:MAG: FecR domain-containing protein [Steroidobacter sp.]
MTSNPGLDDEVREQAAAWVVRLHGEPSAVDLERFEQWCNLDPRNERAFDEALAAWINVGEHATATRILAMRHAALGRARRAERRGTSDPWKWRALAAAICLFVLAPIISVVWYKTRPPAEQIFQTAHGEQRVIVLADGSRMSLDALSEVRVSYTPDVRNLQLISGRANFEVTKDVTRPFKVRSGPRIVTALGTVFSVEREAADVVVTLVEGSVAVTTRDVPNAHIQLRPLQELRITDSGQVSLRDGIDPVQALAWRDGKLIFDDEPLRSVAARMNNYGATRIEVTGEANDLRVGGVFKAGDTMAFVDAMQMYFPLAVSHESNAVTLRMANPDQARKLAR